MPKIGNETVFVFGIKFNKLPIQWHDCVSIKIRIRLTLFCFIYCVVFICLTVLSRETNLIGRMKIFRIFSRLKKKIHFNRSSPSISIHWIRSSIFTIDVQSCSTPTTSIENEAHFSSRNRTFDDRENFLLCFSRWNRICRLWQRRSGNKKRIRFEASEIFCFFKRTRPSDN